MNALILLEDEKYQPIVTKLMETSNVTIEVSNIDFNITNAVKGSEVILFLGDGTSYELFAREYQQLLANKLLFTTTECLQLTEFEIEVVIKCGIIICRIPDYPLEIRNVIIEVAANVFEGSLKQFVTDENGYQNAIAAVESFELDLANLAKSGLETLPPQIVQQIIGTFSIKKHIKTAGWCYNNSKE